MRIVRPVSTMLCMLYENLETRRNPTRKRFSRLTGPTFCTAASERVYISEGLPILGPATE